MHHASRHNVNNIKKFLNAQQIFKNTIQRKREKIIKILKYVLLGFAPNNN
jgi:hypothetical protein